MNLDIDMRNGYRFCVDDENDIVQIYVIDKNTGKFIFDNDADIFVNWLKLVNDLKAQIEADRESESE